MGHFFWSFAFHHFLAVYSRRGFAGQTAADPSGEINGWVSGMMRMGGVKDKKKEKIR